MSSSSPPPPPSPSPSCYWQGNETLKVPMALHAKNRRKLLERFDKLELNQKGSFVLLQGGSDIPRYNTDVSYTFLQESFFHYLFGVHEPDFYGAIDLETGKSMLFIPRLDPAWIVWMGVIEPPSHFQKKYEVDEAYYVDELEKVLKDKGANLLHINKGTNTDSGLETPQVHFKGIEKIQIDNSHLYDELVECRVIKTPEEIEVLRYVNKTSSDAHVKLMKACRPGMKEYQLESLFLHHCYSEGGCRHVGYTCICGSGENSAILHYGHEGAPNNKTVDESDILLIDMGGEYHRYTADITCSFPSSGKFSQRQKNIFEIVHAAQLAVYAALKPGVSWVDMHKIAERTILSGLIRLGLLKGEVEAMMAIRLCALFMPHGLGHFLGIDVHDVGGYTANTPLRTPLPGLKSLRTSRIMEEGMVITVEPGLYFVRPLLLDAFLDPEKKEFLIEEEIQKYFDFGGVRLEDDILITATGYENLTTCPRTVDEIERVMEEGRKERAGL